MKVSEVKCELCGSDVWEASKRGAWLVRVSPKGEEMVMQCRPSCDRNHGDQDDALLGAIRGNEQ